MICAEDEIGIWEKIMKESWCFPKNFGPGLAAAEYFKPYTDYIYEIGLTPNHMDAMSHMGVARDLCAILSHQDKKDYRVKTPVTPTISPEEKGRKVNVELKNTKDCARYSGLTMTDIRIS